MAESISQGAYPYTTLVVGLSEAGSAVNVADAVVEMSAAPVTVTMDRKTLQSEE